MKFRRYQDVDWEGRASSGGSYFEASSLADSEKEQLCQDLLVEFGADSIRQNGDELVHGCLLPFKDHRDQERNPTASLNWKKLTYNCLGCDSGGSITWFVGIMRDESGEQARKWLLEKTGSDTEEGLASLMAFFDEIYTNSGKKSNQYGPMPHMSEDVLEAWHQTPEMVVAYLMMKRGLTQEQAEEAADKFKIGYAPGMTVHMGRKTIHSDRIVLPHFWRDSLVGWQTRRLSKDGTMPYKNSPDFPKDRTLYNYDRDAKEAVIVESVFSVIAKDHTGDHIEATFGASVTDRQLKLISMHPKVVIFADNDPAGWNMTHHLGRFLEAYSVVYVANNPYAADAADIDDQTYRHAVDGALPYSLWSPPKELIPWESRSTTQVAS